VDSVDHNIGVMNEISTASQKQSQEIDQVTQGLDQITSVVQNNSATAQESAAASEELSGQAQMLKELVGHFQLQ
jgi:methyl-accepting chemotaxis protein